MHGSELASLGHDLHVRMHPFQVPQCLKDGLVLGRFSRNTLNRNGILWCVPLVMEMTIGAGMFHLSCGCVAMDW